MNFFKRNQVKKSYTLTRHQQQKLKKMFENSCDILQTLLDSNLEQKLQQLQLNENQYNVVLKLLDNKRKTMIDTLKDIDVLLYQKDDTLEDDDDDDDISQL